MRLTDPIADMLTRIRNALMVKHQEVSIPYSILKESIAKILLEEGYISGYQVKEENKHRNIHVVLKYNETGESVIRGLKRVSTPGRRVYINSRNLTSVLGGLGNGILSTSHGLKTVKNCIVEKVGGEYLCQVW